MFPIQLVGCLLSVGLKTHDFFNSGNDDKIIHLCLRSTDIGVKALIAQTRWGFIKPTFSAV